MEFVSDIQIGVCGGGETSLNFILVATHEFGKDWFVVDVNDPSGFVEHNFDFIGLSYCEFWGIESSISFLIRFGII